MGLFPEINALTKEQEHNFEKNLIWVFGSSRGGTTWLGRQLLSYQTKIMFEPRIARFIGDRRNWVIKNGKKVEKQAENVDYFFSNETKKTWMYFMRKMILNRIYSQISDFSQRILIKEPLERGGSDIISECLPNSKIILLLRDGRDVVDSKLDAIRDKDSWGIKSIGVQPLEQANRARFIRNNSKMWVDLMEDLMRTYNNHEENLRILVRYEDLRNDTVNELRKIYNFLKIDINNDELEKLVAKHSFENIPHESKGRRMFTRFASPGKWNDHFEEEEKNVMNSIMGKTLEQLNYSVD